MLNMVLIENPVTPLILKSSYVVIVKYFFTSFDWNNIKSKDHYAKIRAWLLLLINLLIFRK